MLMISKVPQTYGTIIGEGKERHEPIMPTNCNVEYDHRTILCTTLTKSINLKLGLPPWYFEYVRLLCLTLSWFKLTLISKISTVTGTCDLIIII